MTRPAQKAKERQQVEAFLSERLPGTTVEENQDESTSSPDFWVKATGLPRIAIEVTEYHPDAEGVPGVRRAEIQGRWHKELPPRLDTARRSLPALQHIQVWVDFTNLRLPKSDQHEPLSQELVRLVETVAPEVTGSAHEVNIDFLPRQQLARYTFQVEGLRLMPAEDWPLCSKHFSNLTIRRWDSINWPPWSSARIETAWVYPCAETIKRAVDAKARKARKYDLGGSPVRLLIAHDLPGDMQSWLGSLAEAEISDLLQATRQAGLILDNTPFEEVWLLAHGSGERYQLKPAPSLATG